MICRNKKCNIFACRTNKNSDVINNTNGGTYQISIGGHIFPQIAFSATNNKAAMQQIIFFHDMREYLHDLYWHILTNKLNIYFTYWR